MALPTIRLSSAPPSHSQAPAPKFNRRVNEAKTSVVSILNVRLKLIDYLLSPALIGPAQDTDWPKMVTKDVQALIETMDTLPDIEKITKDETQMPGDVKGSIEQVLRWSQPQPLYAWFHVADDRS